MLSYDVKHPVRVVQHFIIPEPQHAKPLFFEPLVAAGIGFTVSVLAAVDLDDEALGQTDEIDDISADRDLSLELEVREAMRA
ncbi:hypothetical protein BH11PSE4_BH11PSE4_43640 [soil metagenome]